MSAATGDRFKVNTPQFVTTFGQGNPPEGFTIRVNGKELEFAWGESLEADENLDDLTAIISGTRYLRADVIDQIMSIEPSALKCTRRASNKKKK